MGWWGGDERNGEGLVWIGLERDKSDGRMVVRRMEEKTTGVRGEMIEAGYGR